MSTRALQQCLVRHAAQAVCCAVDEGLITYIRTDGTSLSADAVQGLRAEIKQRFGGEYMPSRARQYKTKVKNAQEAHEAIRWGVYAADAGAVVLVLQL